jgi:hypothetical protein
MTHIPEPVHDHDPCSRDQRPGSHVRRDMPSSNPYRPLGIDGHKVLSLLRPEPQRRTGTPWRRCSPARPWPMPRCPIRKPTNSIATRRTKRRIERGSYRSSELRNLSPRSAAAWRQRSNSDKKLPSRESISTLATHAWTSRTPWRSQWPNNMPQILSESRTQFRRRFFFLSAPVRGGGASDPELSG